VLRVLSHPDQVDHEQHRGEDERIGADLADQAGDHQGDAFASRGATAPSANLASSSGAIPTSVSASASRRRFALVRDVGDTTVGASRISQRAIPDIDELARDLCRPPDLSTRRPRTQMG
jgi:hypothetical protein